MTGLEIGLISVVIILVLIYAGMYVPVALGLVSFFSVWYLRGSMEAPVYLLTLAASSGLEQYHYGCLLYTSPSPRDQRGSRMPSSA